MLAVELSPNSRIKLFGAATDTIDQRVNFFHETAKFALPTSPPFASQFRPTDDAENQTLSCLSSVADGISPN